MWCVSWWLSPLFVVPQHSAGLFPVGYSFVTGGLHFILLFLFQHIPDLPHAAQAVAKVQLAAQAGNVGVKRAGVTARAVIAQTVSYR